MAPRVWKWGTSAIFIEQTLSNPRILAIFSGLCSWTQRDHRSLRRSQPGLDAPQFPGITGGGPRYRLHEKNHEIVSSAIGLAGFSIFYTYFLWGWCAVLSWFFFGSCVEVATCSAFGATKNPLSHFWVVACVPRDPSVMIFRTLDVVKETYMESAKFSPKMSKTGPCPFTKERAEIQVYKWW